MNKSNVKKIYDRNYAQNYNQRFLLNDLSKIEAEFERETIAQLLNDIGDNATWLDVACGTGYFLSCFPEIERSGLDISPAMLETARKANPNIPLIRGDYRDRRPQWEGKWDLVSCMWWAYGYVASLAELEKVFENLARWTSDRGVCFVPICEPDFFGTGEIAIPYDYKDTNRLGKDWGQIQIEALTWTWIDECGGKNNKSMIAPKLEYVVLLFEKYFERVDVVEYPDAVNLKSRAIIARHKKTQITVERENFSLFKLIRSREWWLYKIAPLLSIACAETLFLQLLPTQATLTALTALLSIASVAAYGYLLNDICDIESDRKANKPNAAANLQSWQRLLLGLVFVSSGFALPLLTHLGALPIALLCANYLVPTLYSAPPLRLKERGIWGILSDAAGAHLIPTLFVAAAFLSHAPDPPRNVLIFTGLAAAHAFFVGLRGILLHQLWDRENDAKSNTTTFVSQRDPETVRRWINRFVFPVEISLLGSVAVLLSGSSPSLIPVLVAYVIFTVARLKVTKTPLNPSPAAGRNIVPHDLYEVWLPLTLATLLASRDPYYLGFVVLTLVLFFPAVKLRAIELVGILKAAILLAQRDPIAMPKTNVVPLTPEMQQQLETEGYVVLENFLTPDELEDLRAFDRAHPMPEDLAPKMESYGAVWSTDSSDLSYRQKLAEKFKSVAGNKIKDFIPGSRILFCPWIRKKANSTTNTVTLHQDPSFTDESQYRCLGLWVPLNDVDVEGGCLHVVKGSHHLNNCKRPSYTLKSLQSCYGEDIISYVEENYLTPLPLKAGQAVVFDKRLFHGSPPNTSDIERLTATCFIMLPESAPLYFCYMKSEDADRLEVYEVDDGFYDRYVSDTQPECEGGKLVGVEKFSWEPITFDRLCTVLDPFHRDRDTAEQQEAIQEVTVGIQLPDEETIELSNTCDAAFRLTSEMKHQLDTEGYIILDNFLSLNELEKLQALVDSVPVPDDATNYTRTLFYESDPELRKHHDETIRSVVSSKVKTLLPDYRTDFCTWVRKEPNCTVNPTTIHPDPSHTNEPQFVSYNLWFATTDVDPANSCLQIVKGSHPLESNPRPYNLLFPYSDEIETFLEENYLTTIPLKAGQAILLDRRLIHGAFANPSPVERVAFTCLICPADRPIEVVYRSEDTPDLVEIYQIEDGFFHHYSLGDRPSGRAKFIKKQPYKVSPLTPKIIAKQLNPFHRYRPIARLQSSTQNANKAPSAQPNKPMETQAWLQKSKQLSKKAPSTPCRYLLTSEMKHQLETEGYVILDNFISFEELGELQNLVDSTPVPEGVVDYTRNSFLESDPERCKRHDRIIRSVVSSKVKALLPDYRTDFCTWMRKSRNSMVNPIEIHQDPSHTDEPHDLSYNLWFPTMDVNPSNGCLKVVKGSHHLNSHPRPYDPLFAYSDEIANFLETHYLTPVPMKAGQAILFDRRLVHGSFANPSETERVAFTCMLCPADRPTQLLCLSNDSPGFIETYQVDDEFFHRHYLRDRPTRQNAKFIKKQPYTFAPLTPEIIAEKLGPLHRARAIPPLKTELPQAHTEDRETCDRRRELKAEQHRERLMSIIRERSRREP